MAKSKSKKTEKKSTPKTTAHKEAEVKETVVVSETVVETAPKEAVAVASCPAKPLKGFFARKYDVNENVLTIFKSPRVWGALLGELVGTMLHCRGGDFGREPEPAGDGRPDGDAADVSNSRCALHLGAGAGGLAGADCN